MLQTQVAYWANKENARHNLVTESQTNVDLKRKQAELDQTIRYQTDQVQYWRDQLAELTRHNKATENLTAEELKTKQDQAKAALQQAEAALKNAETNRRDLDNKAKQAAAAQSQAKTAHEKMKTDRIESGSRVTANQSRSNLDSAKAGTERQRRDSYMWSDVLVPTIKAVLPW